MDNIKKQPAKMRSPSQLKNPTRYKPVIKGKFEFDIRLPEAIGLISLLVGIVGLVLAVIALL